MSRFSILLNKSLLETTGSQKNSKITPCSSDRYDCLLKIYSELKTHPIFQNVFPFIQGGFALYLYGYNDIMRKYPIVGTDDIDIHIESIPDKTLDDYNKLLQKSFLQFCKRYDVKPGLNKISGKWYYGTSEYCDITYEDNYSSLKLYKEYYLANGHTEDDLEKHLVSNNLLLPLEYVKFNCIHMFCILLHGFNTHSYNNRIPKTLKILKRVLMIYDYENYEIFDKSLDEYLNKLLEIIKKPKISEHTLHYNMDKINENLNGFYQSFISKKDYTTTKMLVFLLEELNIQPTSQNGGGNHLLDNCFYNDSDEINLDMSKTTYNYNDFILLNNIYALVFQSIILNNLTNTEITKSIIQYFNITKIKNNKMPVFQALPISIPVSGGFNKQYKTMKTRKYQSKSKRKTK